MEDQIIQTLILLKIKTYYDFAWNSAAATEAGVTNANHETPDLSRYRDY